MENVVSLDYERLIARANAAIEHSQRLREKADELHEERAERDRPVPRLRLIEGGEEEGDA
jgi:hypothetical protein